MMWARLPDQRFDLLSRVMHDHALIGGSKLRDVVETVRFCDTQTIELRERADRPTRQATLCLELRPGDDQAAAKPARRRAARRG